MISEQCKNKIDNIINNNTTVLGAGGYGIIYLLGDGTVLKAIKQNNDCFSAEKELKKQEKIYNSFEYLKKFEIDDKFIDMIKKTVIISNPIDSCIKDIHIDKYKYSCFFVMSRLHGIPFYIYDKYEKYSGDMIMKRIDPEYLKEKGINFEIMGHLSFNTSLVGFYGNGSMDTIISNTSHPRGYFIPKESNFLNMLREKYDLKLSDDDIEKIIGFVYGWIFYFAKIIPWDIEFTLGYYDGEWKINIVDFGMTIDMNKFEEIDDNQKFIDIKKLVNKKKSINELNNEEFSNLEELTKFDIGIDFYSDIDEENNPIGYEGWNYAKLISSKYTLHGGYDDHHFIDKYNKYIEMKKLKS